MWCNFKYLPPPQGPVFPVDKVEQINSINHLRTVEHKKCLNGLNSNGKLTELGSKKENQDLCGQECCCFTFFADVICGESVTFSFLCFVRLLNRHREHMKLSKEGRSILLFFFGKIDNFLPPMVSHISRIKRVESGRMRREKWKRTRC